MTVKTLVLICIMAGALHAQDTIQPVPRSKTAPEYPESAKKLRVEAQVFLRVLVGTNGSVREAELLQAAVKYPGGSALVVAQNELTKVPASHRNSAAKLIEISQHTVKQWRFTPAKINGVPEEAVIVVPFTYRLTTDPAPVQPKKQFKR